MRVDIRQCLLLLVALTAGCAGLAGGPSIDNPQTPVPVPTADPGLAPGVSPSGTGVDADRLLAADAQVRANSSYTIERTVTVAAPSGSVRLDRVRRIGPNATTEQVVVDVTGELPTGGGAGPQAAAVVAGDLWSNGSVTWTRTRLSNGRVLTSTALDPTSAPYGYGVELRARLLEGGTFVVEPTPGDNVVLTSTGTVELAQPIVGLSLRDPRNATARLTVAPDGLVTGISLAYDAALRDRRVTVTVAHRLVDRGVTTPRRPGWIPGNG